VAWYIEERGGLKLFTLGMLFLLFHRSLLFDKINYLSTDLVYPFNFYDSAENDLPDLPDRMPSIDLSQMDPLLLFPGASTRSPAAAGGNETNNKNSSQPTFGTASTLLESDTSLPLPDADTNPVDQLLSSAKLFAVMDLAASQELYSECKLVKLAPFEQLFSAGESSDSGVYIVNKGKLGSYLDNRKEHQQHAPPPQPNGSDDTDQHHLQKHLVHVSTLTFGNSIGDLDVLDGAPRSVTACARESGCELLQIDRQLFLKTVSENPRFLQSYLNNSIARLWRVAHFTLRDFLQQPPESLSTAATSSGGGVLNKNAAGTAGDPSSAEHEAFNNGKSGFLTGEQAITLAEAVLMPQVVDAAEAAAVPTPAVSSSISPAKGSKKDKEQRRVSFSDTQMSAVLDAATNQPASPAAAAAAPPLPVLVHTHYASVDGGWDVVTPEESSLKPTTLVLLAQLAAPTSTATVDASREESSTTFSSAGRALALTPGTVLMELDEPVDDFFILLEGSLIIERPAHGKKRKETALVAPGSLLGGGSFLTLTNSRAKAWAVGEGCLVVAISQEQIDMLITEAADDEKDSAGEVVTDLLLAAVRALGPTIRQFISLGLTREWFHAGEVIYKAGQPAESLYIIISGRARLLHLSNSSLGGSLGSSSAEIVDDIGRGDSMGAIWTIAGGRHDTTCLCARDVEVVKMNKFAFELLVSSRPKAAARVLQGMAERLSAANSSRRVSTGNFDGGNSSSGSGGAGKLGEIATIAILPAGTPLNNKEDETEQENAVSQLAEALRANLESTCGPTSLLDFATVQRMFPTESEHLDVPFFRSKVTTWLSQQEEDCRFIILQGGSASSGGSSSDGNKNKNNSSAVWNKICADQADCILLAADAATTDPAISHEENTLVWKSMQTAAQRLQRAFSQTTGQTPQGQKPLKSGFDSDASIEFGDSAFIEALQHSTGSGNQSVAAAAAATNAASTAAATLDLTLRRVELVLLHAPNSLPHGTLQWLESRPHLTRHHHIRLSRPESIARLGRFLSNAAVGVVLSGGGSRGLAHIGILRALIDAGVPIDVVGGTSQGAMMAALFAQDTSWVELQSSVRKYAAEMGSPRRLAGDLTLPLLSLFTGAALDQVVQDAFTSGPHRIEDLWLQYFCVTTNLSLGAPKYHQRGALWRAVRASMTLIGLVPPVVDELTGHLLCDGGYSDNLPVAAMRDHVGPTGTVIVVDVEDRDQSSWEDLSSTDGGISGWKILWDRWCPVKKWKYGIRVPGHASIMNGLTWMAHKQNLARFAREGQRVDLYLRPPVNQYRIMDYHLADRIALEANRYAFLTIAQWQRRVGGRGNVPFSAQQVIAAAELGSNSLSKSGGTGTGGTAALGTKGSLGIKSSTFIQKRPQVLHQQQVQQRLQRFNSTRPPRLEGELQLRRGGASSMLKRRTSSVRCMSQLQAKLDDSDEDEDTSSSSTTDGNLLAPLQLLKRASTMQPNLAVNLAFQKLEPLQEVSGEFGSLSSSFRGDTRSLGLGEGAEEEVSSRKREEEEEKSTVVEAAAAAAASSTSSSSSFAPPADQTKNPKEEVKKEDTEDQFAYLNDIEIEFDDDDLPS
jgi:predicted acylesterase/phospholipase RssA/CRP-like cAMP-binding protein